MKFHIKIKFRALNITFGTIDQVIDGAATVAAALKAFAAVMGESIPAVALLDLSTLVDQIKVAPHVIYNERGLLLEVVSS